MSDDTRDDGPYKVGYGRPPEHSRFQKGKSGNPRGRPKKHRNVSTILGEVAAERVRMRIGDQVRNVSTVEALLRACKQKALQGDLKSMITLLNMLLDNESKSERQSVTHITDEDDQATIDAFLKRQANHSAREADGQ